MTFEPDTFGKLNADDYDLLHDPGTTDETVALIAQIAAGGRTLELAIGTGGIALPLAAQGLNIHGIEGSPEMVAKLREKPGGEAIPVVIGDFADVAVTGPFDLQHAVQSDFAGTPGTVFPECRELPALWGDVPGRDVRARRDAISRRAEPAHDAGRCQISLAGGDNA